MDMTYLQYTACRMTMLPTLSLHFTHIFDLSYFKRPLRDELAQRTFDAQRCTYEA